jgi:hypothetical protein
MKNTHAQHSRPKTKKRKSKAVTRQGYWRLDQACGDCGTGLRGNTYVDSPDFTKAGFGPKCDGGYNGRPRGRCGWRTTLYWIYVP